MKKISKTAKAIDRGMAFLFWLSAVAGILTLIIAAAIIIGGEKVLGESGYLSVCLDIIRLDFSANSLQGENFLDATMLLALMVAPVNAAVCCFGIKIFRDILKPMKNALPFDGSVSKNIEKLGWTFGVGSVIINVMNAVIGRTVLDLVDLTAFFESKNITGYSVSYEFDVTFIIVAAVLFLLSYVFRYGEELQKQADETL